MAIVDDGFQDRFARESWSLYSFGMLVIILRLYAQISQRGIKHLEIDDWLMVLVACLYTTIITTLNVSNSFEGTNCYPPELFQTFDAADIQNRILGSKVELVSEQVFDPILWFIWFKHKAMLNLIYVIKACLLLLYGRLTLGLKERLYVKWLAVYVVCGWVGSQMAFFIPCRPFKENYAVPPPTLQCATLQDYLITQASFNISSDCLMLLIPIPLVVRMQVPWRRKLGILIVFSLGIFVILSAVLSKYDSLSNIYSSEFIFWYSREAFVAVYVSNIPIIWPLVRRLGKHWPTRLTITKAYGSASGLRRTKTRTKTTRPSQTGTPSGVTTLVQGQQSTTGSTSKQDLELGNSLWEANGRPTVENSTNHSRQGQGIRMSTTLQMEEEHVESQALNLPNWDQDWLRDGRGAVRVIRADTEAWDTGMETAESRRSKPRFDSRIREGNDV
ncbi:MAG: hypothetical protein M1818_000753 [Claussenomyces sp. TS43310]|nr:MAG: hypothetical protein M1818_000753 [Claussenomyces sp. TS43310]